VSFLRNRYALILTAVLVLQAGVFYAVAGRPEEIPAIAPLSLFPDSIGGFSLLKSIPIRSDRFGIEPEITAKVAKLDCVIYEVGISYFGRTYQEGKKIGFGDACRVFCSILRYWWGD